MKKQKKIRLSTPVFFVIFVMVAIPFLRAEGVHFKEQETVLYKDVFDQNIYYEGMNQLDLSRWGRKLFGKKIPAGNVNVFDEIPDSEFFTNRHARKRLSAEALERGYSETPGPDISQPMTVTKGKQNGLHPGFFIKDAKGDAYLLKFDAEGYLELATAAEVVTSRFYYAIGYNVPQYTLFRFTVKDIVPGVDTYTYDDTGFRKKMTREILDQYLSFLPVTDDGEYLASASKIISGKNAGHFSLRSRRKDDSEDPINHRDRREIRALAVFSTWLNNYDVRESNTLDAEITKDGKPVLKHYIYDFNSALGAAKGGPKPPMFGYEHMIDYGEAAKAFLSLGFWEKPWQGKWRMAGETTHSSPAIGYFDNRYFNPANHKLQLPYEAFRVLTRADGFWASKILMNFTDDDIRAMVKAGQYTMQEDEDYLVKTLSERRDLIARYWFFQAAPLDDFEFSQGQLRFKDLAVDHGFESPEGRSYLAEISEAGGKPGEKVTLVTNNTLLDLKSMIRTQPGGQLLECTIRVTRRGVKAPSSYVKVTVDANGIRGIRHED